MQVINCESVCKTYRQGIGQRAGKAALDNFSFSVDKGEVVGIIGPNGAGKSTLIKTIMGFVRASSGRITIKGRDCSDPDCHVNIGYLPETATLYNKISIRDHLLFAARISGMSRSERASRMNAVLHTVDLEKQSNLPLRNYSKGMTQRAALAYALFSGPEILILDEPMSGLDPMGRQLVIDIMRTLHEDGITILFCSHILNDVERICNRIGIMSQGRLALVTTPEQLKANFHNRPAHLTPLETCFLQTINETSAKDSIAV
jgi:ABC-2 type transport system ATP-binding protein